MTSEACTRGVRVHVAARYSPAHSAPSQSHWFFLYTIRIENEGDEGVQLLGRHWVITDASGEVEEVRGPGVVGAQPRLSPGQSFEYTSGCPLKTPFGSMRGSYEMVTADGEKFDAEVALFELSQPHAIH
ncbi:MAG: Co2+/Mg2+ efflux protein ApaG [Myxococcales bacterium FL481]|nr:MAG: Co2+/Mg2+ efflux protein ApaG [Myxococcales bacterium FL481]